MAKIKEVDLNMRHYVGARSDVIKDIKVRISNYLRNPNIADFDRAIYSAIYNALTYYQNISDISISGESADKTFLENMLKDFNEDVRYLSDKYNSKDPKAPKVIEVKGRIKSPVSAMDKILEKVAEYVSDGRDLTRLNESLRDFIGLRIIVNPPPEIQAKGRKPESDFCYTVFDDLMKRKGIMRQISGEDAQEKDYEFLTVNTSHDPNKQKKIEERAEREGFDFDPIEEDVFIPINRPSAVNSYHEYFKDYRMFPKKKLYQRLHTCAKPFFSKHLPEERIPTFIIPPNEKSKEPAIEYQICLKKEELFAEYGKAAHSGYKDRTFHRLAIPLLMFFDESTDKVRLGRLDESMEEFYGYSFQDYFNIDYQDFLRTFDSQQRDDILAGNLKVILNEQTNEYMLVPGERVIVTDKKQSPKFLQELLQSASKEELTRFYEVNGILDGTIYPQSLTTSQKVRPKIKIYNSAAQPTSQKRTFKTFFNKKAQTKSTIYHSDSPKHDDEHNL